MVSTEQAVAVVDADTYFGDLIQPGRAQHEIVGAHQIARTVADPLRVGASFSAARAAVRACTAPRSAARMSHLADKGTCGPS